MAADQDDRGGPGGRSDLRTQRRDGDRGHHSDGKGNRQSHGCVALLEGPSASGGARSRSGPVSSPELRAARAASVGPGRALCPCAAVQADAQGAAAAEGLYWPRDAGHPAPTGPSDNSLRQRIEVEVALVDRLLRQKPKGNGKLYALHEPKVDCISKGKARVRYEFGTKVSVTTTYKEGFVVGMRSMPGNPYDGHTLREALEQVEILAETRPKRAFVDRGYRGHGVQTTAVYIAGQKRGMTPALQRDLRRRSAIEPMIGHMKTDGRLGRCALKGTLGDALHAVLCGCGHNIRMILAHLRALWVQILAALLGAFGARGSAERSDCSLKALDA